MLTGKLEYSHSFYISLVELVSRLSTCDRAHVGAAIVKEGRLLGTGYNTSAIGLPTCIDAGHLMIGGHCCRTIHAEHNAILDVALSEQVLIRGATMYTTHEPCVHCRKLIIQMGIARVIYKYAYRSSLQSSEISGDVEWIHYDTLQKDL